MASNSFALLVLLGLAGTTSAQTGFQAIVLHERGPALSNELAVTLRGAGFSGISIAATDDVDSLRDLGLRFVVRGLAGEGALHVSESAFERALRSYEAARSTRGLRRPHPLLSGSVRATMLECIEKFATPVASLRPLFASFADRVSTTRFDQPLDFCHDPTTLRGFRTWLRARYGSIGKLNRAWERRFDSFASVQPPTTDAVRKRARGQLLPRLLVDWNDFREYMDLVLAKTIGLLADRTRELAPSMPAGFGGGGAPSAFGGTDWASLGRVAAAVAPDGGAAVRELVRSFKRTGTLHFETVRQSSDPTYGWLPIARLYDAAAHGLDGVLVEDAGKLFESARKLTPYGRQLARELPRLTGAGGRALAGAEAYAGEIAILESQSSVRLHWMVDSMTDGETWTRRRSHRDNSTSHAARLSWVRLLQDLGYAFRFVTPEALQRGRARARVLVLPSSLSLSDATARAIERFARNGGLVIADETPGIYTERLRLRDRPALDRLFGVTRTAARRFVLAGHVRGAPRTAAGLAICESGLEPEGMTVASQIDDVGMAVAVDDPRLRRPRISSRDRRVPWCQFERTHGRGRCVLLNLGVVAYARERLVESRARPCRRLRSRVRRLFDKHGLRESVLVRVRGYPTVLERIVLSKGKRRVLVVRANCAERPELMQQLIDKGPQKMTIVLPFAAKLRDLWTGKTIGRPGRQIDVQLDPLRGSFFLIERL